MDVAKCLKAPLQQDLKKGVWTEAATKRALDRAEKTRRALEKNPQSSESSAAFKIYFWLADQVGNERSVICEADKTKTSLCLYEQAFRFLFQTEYKPAAIVNKALQVTEGFDQGDALVQFAVAVLDCAITTKNLQNDSESLALAFQGFLLLDKVANAVDVKEKPVAAHHLAVGAYNIASSFRCKGNYKYAAKGLQHACTLLKGRCALDESKLDSMLQQVRRLFNLSNYPPKAEG